MIKANDIWPDLSYFGHHLSEDFLATMIEDYMHVQSSSGDFSQDQARDLFEQFFGQMGRGGGRASAGGFGFSPFGGFHFQEDPVSAGHVGEDIQARLR